MHTKYSRYQPPQAGRGLGADALRQLQLRDEQIRAEMRSSGSRGTSHSFGGGHSSGGGGRGGSW